jgi:phage portal protein BeeE
LQFVRFPGMLTTMSTIAVHEANILRRVVDPQRAGWTRETAEAILALRLPKRDASRASTLARKACAGSLSPAEARELEDYKHIGRFLELMQSRARLSLKDAGAA